MTKDKLLAVGDRYEAMIAADTRRRRARTAEAARGRCSILDPSSTSSPRPDGRGARRDHRAQPGARGAVAWCCASSPAPCIWLLLEAEFLAIALVLVYVGAVMVLFLFVVMMLDINIEQLREGFTRYLPLGAASSPA